METKSITTVTTRVDQDGQLIGDMKQAEFETFNAHGAIFFQKEGRGFIVPINRFSAELTSSDIEKFGNLFWGRYAATGTNRLELPGTRRKFKEMDRAELAEAMGFEGTTAVKKATTQLNKFIQLGVMAKKMNGKVEEWYVNPLLIKTSHRLSPDLFELFQPSLEEAMAKQTMILSFLKAAVREKYVSQVTTMTHSTARKEIAKEQYKEKLLEDAKTSPEFISSPVHTEAVAAAIEEKMPSVVFNKPRSGLLLEETRSILSTIYSIAGKGGQQTATEDDMAELNEASHGMIHFTNRKKAPAATGARTSR